MKSSRNVSPSPQHTVEELTKPTALTELRVPQVITEQRRTLGYLARQFFSPSVFKDTGLEELPVREFLELAREKRAFYHATETDLRTGWWSSLLARSFLQSPESGPFREYLSGHVRNGAVVEIGPGEQAHRHRDLLRGRFGATHYLSVDLQKEPERWGAVCSDVLSYFSLFENASVDTIMAFGVFNEPMSLQFPGHAPPHFLLPARRPEEATRAHCEHEYVRRLAREMMRALKPGGVLLGDGLHSRGFELEVETYLRRAGFVPDERGVSSLDGVPLMKRHIRDPFFFIKK